MVKGFLKTIFQKYFVRTQKVKRDLHGFDYTVSELVNMYQQAQQNVEWHGQILSDEIKKYKSSDTVFVLGSGPSINEITNEQWDQIANYDSIGFNYWFVHDFVPDLYVSQIPKDDVKIESMKRVFADKIGKYQQVPFILRGSGFADGLLNERPDYRELFKQVTLYYLLEYPIAGRCSIPTNTLFEYMDALGYMEFDQISKFIPKWRSTVGLLLMLCYQMGYDNIVLCGIDMQGSDHFWDYGKYQDEKEKYKLPDVGDANINTFTDKDLSSNTVPEYVYSLRDWFYEKNEVKIYSITKNSVLYPEIELYKI